MDKEFFTFSEYLRKNEKLLSPSEEDYMEMIYRLSRKRGYTRVTTLASALNVQPPSVTKMIQKFAEMKLIKYERYSVIKLEPLGEKIGKSLLDRHDLVERFLILINVRAGLLEATEKLEHLINGEVYIGINSLVDFFNDNPVILESFKKYSQSYKSNEEI